MHEFVTDKSFDLEKTFEYILSIQVSLNGFSFSVVCPTENKLLAFNHTPLKISSESLITRRFKDWISSERLFSKTFKKVQLILFSKEFTLVPEKYFNSEVKTEIPNLLFEHKRETEIAENFIIDQKSRIVFTLPKGMNKIITEYFGECEIIHPIKLVANKHSKTDKKYCLRLIIETGNFYITLFKEGKIILANNFDYAHTNDLIYYVLTTLKQLSISPKETELVYSGTLENENTLSTLQKYFIETNEFRAKESLNIDSNFQIPVSQNSLTLLN
jgi:hypothetical protein